METPDHQRQILRHVDEAVQNLGRLDGLLEDEEQEARTAARKSLGRALAAVLQGPEAGETPELRAILDGLVQLVEVRVDLNRLLLFRNQVRQLHHQLAHTGAQTSEASRVVEVGPPGMLDYHRVLRTSPTTTLTLLGTPLTQGAPAAMSAGVLAGAISVASRGMGPRLGPPATLTILDKALKESLVDAAPASMVAWRHDNEARKLTVAAAGHRPIWRIRDGKFETVRTEASEPLGMVERAIHSVSIETQPGDLIVAFTAGILEQDDAKGNSIRERDLRGIVLDAQPTADAIADAVERFLERHNDDWDVPATFVVTRLD